MHHLAPGRSLGGCRDPATLWPRKCARLCLQMGFRGPHRHSPTVLSGHQGKASVNQTVSNFLHSREKPGQNLEPHHGANRSSARMTEKRAEPRSGGHTAVRQASGGACHTGEAVLFITRLEQA